MRKNSRYVLALVVSLLSAAFVRAIDIPREMWQPNRHPGYCAWVSLKTALIYEGWQQIADVVLSDEDKMGGGSFDQFGNMNPPGGSYPEKMKGRLEYYHKRFGLEYEWQNRVEIERGAKPDQAHIDFIRKAIKHGLPCVITVSRSAHAVDLVDIDDEPHSYRYDNGELRKEPAIFYIDNNDVLSYDFQKKLYEEGRITNAPEQPQTRSVSMTWWVNNDWDGFACCVFPPNKRPLDEDESEDAHKTDKVNTTDKHLSVNNDQLPIAPPPVAPKLKVPAPPKAVPVPLDTMPTNVPTMPQARCFRIHNHLPVTVPVFTNNYEPYWGVVLPKKSEDELIGFVSNTVKQINDVIYDAYQKDPFVTGIILTLLVEIILLTGFVFVVSMFIPAENKAPVVVPADELKNCAKTENKVDPYVGNVQPDYDGTDLYAGTTLHDLFAEVSKSHSESLKALENVTALALENMAEVSKHAVDMALADENNEYKDC